MILTAVIFIFLLAALIKPLRHGSYALHTALLLLCVWIFEQHVYATYPFTAFAMNTALWVVLLHMVMVNITTLCVYIYDKKAARKQAWRVPEKTLHAYALIGGTPAAMLARKFLRHKSAKRSFLIKSWIILVVQITVIFVLIWQSGKL